MPSSARQYWQSVSECIKTYCDKKNSVTNNKLNENMDILKLFVRLMSDLANFLKLVDQK